MFGRTFEYGSSLLCPCGCGEIRRPNVASYTHFAPEDYLPGRFYHIASNIRSFQGRSTTLFVCFFYYKSPHQLFPPLCPGAFERKPPSFTFVVIPEERTQIKVLQRNHNCMKCCFCFCFFKTLQRLPFYMLA